MPKELHSFFVWHLIYQIQILTITKKFSKQYKLRVNQNIVPWKWRTRWLIAFKINVWLYTRIYKNQQQSGKLARANKQIVWLVFLHPPNIYTITKFNKT